MRKPLSLETCSTCFEYGTVCASCRVDSRNRHADGLKALEAAVRALEDDVRRQYERFPECAPKRPCPNAGALVVCRACKEWTTPCDPCCGVSACACCEEAKVSA